MTSTPKRQIVQVKEAQRHYKNVWLHDDNGPTKDGQLEQSKIEVSRDVRNSKGP